MTKPFETKTAITYKLQISFEKQCEVLLLLHWKHCNIRDTNEDLSSADDISSHR